MDETDEFKDKPRLTEVRHAALALLKTCGISEAPVRINSVLAELHKSFDIAVMGATETEIGSKIDAVTKRDGTEVYILYNKSRHVHRQRFSFAHEIGHLQMGHVHQGSQIDIDSTNIKESEANHFAAHILMPPAFLRKDVKAGMKDVKALSDKYQVSELAMWWQIKQAGLLNLL